MYSSRRACEQRNAHKARYPTALSMIALSRRSRIRSSTSPSTSSTRLGLPGVFVLMVLESACIPVPSEATMLFAGFNVARRRVLACSPPSRSARSRTSSARGSPTAIGYARAASTCSRSTARSCTSRRATSNGPTAGSSATATPPSSSRACCRSSARSSRCRPGVARMPFWRFSVLTLLGCIPWVLHAHVHRQAGRRQLGGLEGLPPLRGLRRRGADRGRRHLPVVRAAAAGAAATAAPESA